MTADTMGSCCLLPFAVSNSELEAVRMARSQSRYIIRCPQHTRAHIAPAR